MPDYYNEKAIIMLFLAKNNDKFSMQEQIAALINIVDETTLKFILKLNPQEQGIQDFQKVVRFIKVNQTSIINQLNEKNLFYSRINLTFVLPTFIVYVSAISLMGAAGFCPALALGVALLASFAMIIAVAACSSIIYDNLAKKHLYEEIGRKLSHRTSNYNYNYNGFFNNELLLSFEVMKDLCNLPKIFGITP